MTRSCACRHWGHVDHGGAVRRSRLRGLRFVADFLILKHLSVAERQGSPVVFEPVSLRLCLDRAVSHRSQPGRLCESDEAAIEYWKSVGGVRFWGPILPGDAA
jgi:hypothetical protein